MAEIKKMRSQGSSSGGAENNRGETEVEDVGRQGSSCDYCKASGHTSISYVLRAHSLTVDDYQGLVDRGWRRSGCYLYKPEMDKTCCPSYTIRLKASDFVPSKEQQRVSRRMQRFLDGTLEVKQPEKSLGSPNTSKDLCSLVQGKATGSAVNEPMVLNTEEKNKDEQVMSYLSHRIDNVVRTSVEFGEVARNIQLPKPSVKKVSQGKKKIVVEGSEDPLYTSNISFQIKAALRRGNKLHNTELSGGSKEESEQLTELTPNIIADKLVMHLNNLSDASGLSVKACNGHINFYSTTKQARPDKVAEIVMVQNESRSDNSLKKGNGHPQGKKRRLEIFLNRSSFNPEEYDLYMRYQIKVHNDAPDHVSESFYRRFLVDTLIRWLVMKMLMCRKPSQLDAVLW